MRKAIVEIVFLAFVTSIVAGILIAAQSNLLNRTAKPDQTSALEDALYH